MTLLVTYKTRLINFIKDLESTYIQIIYFVAQDTEGELKVKSKNVLQRWNRTDGISYVSPGNTPGWCYVYLREHLEEFVKIGGGVSGYVGHHITFGLRPSQEKIVMRLHDTSYSVNDTPPNEYDRSEEVCNIYLEGEKEKVVPLDRVCLHKHNFTLDKVFPVGRKRDIIQDMSRIYYGTYTNTGGAKFVQTGKKRYLAKGGAAVLENDFLDFLRVYVFEPVMAVRKDLIGVRLLYDERNELGPRSHKYLVIMYELIDVGMHLYFVDAEKAFCAYRATVGEKTVENNRCLEEFLGMVKKVVVQEGTVV
jgi:hypothetical protein